MLAEGSLSVATVRLLASQLTAGNHEMLLAAARGKSKRAVEEMLAGRFPKPDIPASVRKLPYRGRFQRRRMVRPLAPERYEIRFTASAETREKLRVAQDLLRHTIPDGDPAKIIDRALTVLLEDLARKKFGVTDRPRGSSGSAPGRRDPGAKVRRTVSQRGGGRCTFVSKSGRRCNERAFIEFDHIEPYGVGGEATVGNIRLLCRAHNGFESERFYGHGRPMKNPTLPGKSSPPAAGCADQTRG
jgi:hypothetical protein